MCNHNIRMNSPHDRPSRDPLILLAQEMKLRGFSKNTVKSYTYYITELIKFASRGSRDIQGKDIRDYLEWLVDEGKSASTVNTAYSSLKFYFEKILYRKFFATLPRVKKKKKLPVVLSVEEVRKLLDNISNIKHHTIVSLLYGCGLRVSEVVNIKMYDIDIERVMLHIRSGKGQKDRCVPLPQKLISILCKQSKLKLATDFLFTNGRNSKLTTATVQKIIKNAVKKTCISKHVSPHTLRHTFATHLLENGTSIRYIQKLLGHARMETTQTYVHVASHNLLNITSPLDV